MKRFVFEINEFEKEKIFISIHYKVDIIKIWLEKIRDNLIFPLQSVGDLIIIKHKTQRVFFIKSHQIVSLNFPFIIRINKIKIYIDEIEINNQMISDILEMIECKEFENICSIEFIEPFLYKEEYNENFWQVSKKLLIFDDWYIRYDYDEEHFDSQYPYRHPINHYDIFYSNSATFKLGSGKELELEKFIDMLDTTSDQFFVKEVNEN